MNTPSLVLHGIKDGRASRERCVGMRRESSALASPYVRCMMAAALAIMALGILALPKPALSQVAGVNCAGNFGAINESFRLNRDTVLQAIKNGCPPPANWRHAPGSAGTGLQGFTSKLYLGHLKKSARAANDPLQYYEGACNSYNPTRAGGITTAGAVSPCDLGLGYGLFTVNAVSGAPIVNTQSTSCLTNLFSAITGLLGGGGVGSPNITGGAGVSGNCLSGSIGVCGIGSIGGQICANGSGNANATVGGSGQPYSPNTPPYYVQVSDVTLFNYAYNPINANSAVYAPQGGVMTFGSSTYTIPVGGFVTMSPTGRIYIGNPGGGYVDEDGIQLSSGGANNMVSITPNGGLLQIDSSLVTGQTIGSPTTITTANTVQGANAPAGQAGVTTATNNPGTGPTLIPPAGLLPAGTPYTGSFPPAAISTPVAPPAASTNLPSVLQQVP
jgi:hypothetical protein